MEPLRALPAARSLADLVHDLGTTGYGISDTALDADLAFALYRGAAGLGPRAFAPAGTGRDRDLNPFVRGDGIHWVGPRTPGLDDYLAWMEQLRLAVNGELLLGLFDYECHFARYPVGRFYRTHLDAFRGEANRVVSTVLYLNPHWSADDGGELVIHAPGSTEELARVQPVLGRLVLFLSEEFPHEVLPTRRVRYSLTGWFRVNQSTCRRADPPR